VLKMLEERSAGFVYVKRLRTQEVKRTLYDLHEAIIKPLLCVGADNDWMHTRGYPKRPLMTLEQLKQVRERGVCLGSHTQTHARLTELDSDELKTEISGSKKTLEDLLDQAVRHFAYPFGLYSDAAKDAVADAGYDTACSTRSGFNRADIDPYQLRRIEVYGSDTLAQFQKKISFGVNDMPWYFPARYYMKRIGQKIGIG